METKVSVIMPVYNGEKYLREALDSIRKQTLEEYELICIDDGSTDSTWAILEEYKAQDVRIYIIQNEKRIGAALSRNKALEIAQGEYLCFADADDLRSKEMLEHAYDSAKKREADVVICGMAHFRDGHMEDCAENNNLKAIKEKYCTDTFILNECTPLDNIQLPDDLGGKMFRRNFILSQGLQFQNLSSSNDVYFVMMSMYLAKKILCVKEVLVFQREHETPTRISYDRDPMCAVRAWEKIASELKQSGFWEKVVPGLAMRFLYSMQYAFGKCRKEQRCQEVYEYIRKEILKMLNIEKSDIYSRVNSHVRKCFSLIETEDKVTAWLSDWNYMEVCMEERQIAMENLFSRSGKRVYIWGGGKYGRAIAGYCRQHDFKISAIIDNNPALQGTKIEDIPVVRFENIKNDMDMIIVSSGWFYDEVYRQIRKRNMTVEIVNLMKYLLE